MPNHKNYFLPYLVHPVDFTKDGPGYQVRQDLYNLARRNKLSNKVNLLKKLDSLEELEAFLKLVGPMGDNLRKSIEGCTFPQDIEEMCRMPDYFEKPVSYKSELMWLMIALKSHSQKIRQFLHYKRSFEHNLLTGNMERATFDLDEVKEKLGVSLWYYESRALLLEYSGKREQSLRYLSEILEKCKSHGNSYIPYLFFQLHARSAKDLSAYKYDSDLMALYRQNKTDLHDDYYRFLLFQLNFFNNYETIDLSLPLMFESVASLVDRYLIAVMTLKASFVRKSNLDIACSQARAIYKLTGDVELTPLLIGKAGRKNLLPDYYDEQFIALLDLYFQGDYKGCMQLCTDYIKRDSRLFDVYIIYIRCIVYAGQALRFPIAGDNVPVNDILQRLYQVCMGEDVENAIYSLYQLNKNFYSFHIAASFHTYIMHEKNAPVNERMASAYNLHFDPRYTLIMQKPEAISYLQCYCPDYTRHLCCQHVLSRLGELQKTPSGLNAQTTLADSAFHCFREGDYNGAYTLWEQLFNESENIPVRKKAARYMIDCLFHQERIDELICRYVDIYTQNPQYVSRVRTRDVVDYLASHLFVGVTRNIDLIIFIGNNSSEYEDISYMLYDFCSIYHKSRPSEMSEVLSQVSKERAESFLCVAKDDEVLSDYMNITNDKVRLEEKKAILQMLVNYDTRQRGAYEEELKKVDDALVVHQVNRNMDEHKIYANVPAIMKNELKDIDGLYKRYRSYLDMLLKKYRIYYLDTNATQMLTGDYGLAIENNVNISINNNGIYEVFKALYDTICDRFLNSEYGLVAYLSTRVRHGELEGELRPMLSKSNLILSMSGGVYQPTGYWGNLYALSRKDEEALNAVLASFSERFDKEVINLIKKKLQIYDKDHEEGLFVYQPSVNELETKAVEIGLECQNEEEKTLFCQKVIDWLWQMTDASLTKIRSYISHDFSVKIEGLFDELRLEVKKALPKGHASDEICELIAQMSSAMNMRIKKTENWFNISGVNMEDVDFINLSEQIYKCVLLAHPQYEVTGHPEYSGHSFMIKSGYVLHYTYILKNILYNMIKNGAEMKEGEKQFKILIDITDNEAAFEFKNDVIPGKEDELNKIFKEKMQSRYYFGEGGSGIPKIMKMLNFDLPGKNYFNIQAGDGICTTTLKIDLREIKAHER